MTNDIKPTQILMTPSDVCSLLDIKESTLRKYALLLKNAGYHFHTNEKGQRGYYDKDVIVLKRFLEVKNSADMTLEQTTNAVISWVKASDMSLSVMDNEEEIKRYNADINELKETVNQQNEFLKKLMVKLDEQQRKIDHQQQFINEQLSAQKLQIAASKENDINMQLEQTKLLKELKAQVDYQQKYIESSLEERDEKLMKAIREGQKKKGFWNKFF